VPVGVGLFLNNTSSYTLTLQGHKPYEISRPVAAGVNYLGNVTNASETLSSFGFPNIQEGDAAWYYDDAGWHDSYFDGSAWTDNFTAKLATGMYLEPQSSGTWSRTIMSYVPAPSGLATLVSSATASEVTVTVSNLQSADVHVVFSRTNMNDLAYNYELDFVPTVSTYSVTLNRTGKPAFQVTAIDSTLDSDGDGIPDWWCMQYGLDPRAYVGPLPSDAGDGMTNLEKYQAGQSPKPTTPTFFKAQPRDKFSIF
jgi:hypothetical protein